ncbi:hypothetical protein GWK47_051347 [Chionoecetes opilio]|uniref:Regulatory protein zeste n=1 Tax=Chionoecetes opilio TaxID=41210 RepID=A0A8J4YCW7_CHIOP|nr:hypothetical protein GWK47_051347 [Chionoecetes opilio]
MAARYEASPSRATPISHVDKWVLLDLIKKHIEVINDKTTKLYGINKKAAAWQTIATKLNDLTGYMKTPKQIRKIWENFRNRGTLLYTEPRKTTPTKKLRQQKLDEVHHQLQLIRSRQLSFPCYRMSWSHCTTLLTAIRYIMTKLSLKMLVNDGSMTLPEPREPFIQELSNSAGVTCSVTCHVDDDDDDDGLTETSNATTPTPIRQGPAIKKRKLSTEKEEALRLTAERSQLLRKMDMEVHQKRLELLEHEKMLKNEHFRSLQELQKKGLLEYHEKKIAQLQ